jgi:RNA 3'-terminal phosphate cyclase
MEIILFYLVLRNAMIYSCLLGKPIKITQIRAKRPESGKQYVHSMRLYHLIQNYFVAQV